MNNISKISLFLIYMKQNLIYCVLYLCSFPIWTTLHVLILKSTCQSLDHLVKSVGLLEFPYIFIRSYSLKHICIIYKLYDVWMNILVYIIDVNGEKYRFLYWSLWNGSQHRQPWWLATIQNNSLLLNIQPPLYPMSHFSSYTTSMKFHHKILMWHFIFKGLLNIKAYCINWLSLVHIFSHLIKKYQ